MIWCTFHLILGFKLNQRVGLESNFVTDKALGSKLKCSLKDTVAYRENYFKNGGRSPCWIFEIYYFDHVTCVSCDSASSLQISR